jgi:hypothetical protein
MTADKRAFSVRVARWCSKPSIRLISVSLNQFRRRQVDQADQLDRFDRGVGGLLANAWLHSEALQTTDLPLVFKIISTAFRTALAEEVSRLCSHAAV